MTNRIINLVAFTVLSLLWIAFGAALLFNRELLDTVWLTFRSWNILIQVFVGLLFLPLTLGLWIWETSWPLLLRLTLVIGLAWVTVYMFYPTKTQGQSEASPVKT